MRTIGIVATLGTVQTPQLLCGLFFVGLSLAGCGRENTPVKSAAPEVTAGSVDPQGSPGAVTPTAALPIELRRSDVKAVQKLGPGAIFANVELDPVMRSDRFFGWKIVRMRSAGWKQNELRAGDIVQRVNGQTIERPEDAVQVFKSLDGSKQIVIDFERAGRTISQTSAIVD